MSPAKKEIKDTPAKKRARKRSKTIAKKPKLTAVNARLRKKPKYKSFRLHEPIKHPNPDLPSWATITKKAIQLLLQNSKPLTWFLVVYGILFIIFVSGVVAPIDIDAVRGELEETTAGDSSFSNNVTILTLMLNSSFRASGEVSGMYQMVFFITSALALIWLFRQQQAGQVVSLKEAYYRGMYPLVPFVAVIAVIAFQLIPTALGNMFYGTVVDSGLAVTFIEQVFWFLFFLMAILLSLYLITSSLIALFVVTLPDMTPKVALKEAGLLVQHRRIRVLTRLIALFIIMGIAYIGVVFPSIFVSAALAQVVFFLLTVFALPFIVAYLFILYRELL